MVSGAKEFKTNRRLRLGMVGGGPGAFIGAVHRAAARLDDRYELVAGAFSSDPQKSIEAAAGLHISRSYASFQEMAQKEAKRTDGIDVVAIAVPNHLHYPVVKAFLNAGIHVICDKPLTTTVEDALDVAQMVKATGLIFGLTHAYTGYPMVRQARQMVRSGELGAIRVIQVQYAQDWLTSALESTGQKQADWRTDPERTGPGGCVGDIGTHAFQMVSFVTGLTCDQLAAEATTFVPGRRVDDNVQVLLRYSGGAKGSLWASQVAPGNENNLRLQVYGERGGLSWEQENPNYLTYSPYGDAPRRLGRGGPGLSEAAAHATRMPTGHPEGLFEAFAQLYTDVAEQIAAQLEGRAPDPQSLLVPGIDDGVQGVRFVNAVLESSRRNSAWVKMPAASDSRN